MTFAILVFKCNYRNVIQAQTEPNIPRLKSHIFTRLHLHRKNVQYKGHIYFHFCVLSQTLTFTNTISTAFQHQFPLYYMLVFSFFFLFFVLLLNNLINELIFNDVCLLCWIVAQFGVCFMNSQCLHSVFCCLFPTANVLILCP